MELLKNLKEESILFLDIETVRNQETLDPNSPEYDAWEYKENREGLWEQEDLIQSYEDKAALYPEFAKIVCISMGMIVDGILYVQSYSNEDEETLLRAFNRDLERTIAATKNLKIFGQAIIGFDIPFIFKRCMVNRVTPCPILETAGEKPWTVTERFLDLKDLWKGTSFNSASLIATAVALGVPHSKDDISGKDVGKVYYKEGKEGLSRIVHYCEKDVLTTANIFKALRFESFLEMASQERELDDSYEVPLLVSLASGASFGAQVKKQLADFIEELSVSERESALHILESLAKSKKSKVTDKFVKELRERYAEPA